MSSSLLLGVLAGVILVGFCEIPWYQISRSFHNSPLYQDISFIILHLYPALNPTILIPYTPIPYTLLPQFTQIISSISTSQRDACVPLMGLLVA